MGDICDQDMLKPWSTSWFPGIGYVCDKKYWDMTPSGIRESAKTSNGGNLETLNKDDDGKLTYVPKSYSGGAKNVIMSGPWGSGEEVLPAWVNRDIVGHYALVLVDREPNRVLGPPKNAGTDQVLGTFGSLAIEDKEGRKIYMGPSPYMDLDASTPWNGRRRWMAKCHEAPRPCWMFACVSGYNSYDGTHTLTFKEDGCYYPINGVNLRNCIFQEWTRPDIRQHNVKDYRNMCQLEEKRQAEATAAMVDVVVQIGACV